MRWVTATGGTIELVDAFSVEENVPCPIIIDIGNEDKFTGSWPREGFAAHSNSNDWGVPIRMMGGSKIEWLEPRYGIDYSEEHVLYPFLKSNGAHQLRIRVLEWPWTLRVAETGLEPTPHSRWIRYWSDETVAGREPLGWEDWIRPASPPQILSDAFLREWEEIMPDSELVRRARQGRGRGTTKDKPPTLPGVGDKGHRIMDGGDK